MKTEFIVTMANETVRLRFTAMERSLRATGCRLPLRVIPYDDRRFPLPEGANWWEDAALFEFLDRNRAHPTMRKYLCLLAGDYQFVDSDVVFLRNPEVVLRACEGWIASCGSWRDPAHVMTSDLGRILRGITPLFQQRLFNTGQFACDRPLYDREELQKVASDPAHRATTLEFPYHEQPGLNLLISLTRVPFHNLTLPPTSMESTWAGDYPGEFEHFWSNPERAPYLIHWAGCGDSITRPIDALYLRYFTTVERLEWERQAATRQRERRAGKKRLAEWRRRLAKAARECRSILRSGATSDRPPNA